MTATADVQKEHQKICDSRDDNYSNDDNNNNNNNNNIIIILFSLLSVLIPILMERIEKYHIMQVCYCISVSSNQFQAARVSFFLF